MPLRYLDDAGYALGMIRDLPSWQIPPGGVYDSLNMVYDAPGIARMRMGSTNLVSGAQTAFATSLGFVYSQDGNSTIEELYGVDGKTGNVNVINKSTGAATSVGAAIVTAGIVGRPARYFGFTAFPIATATIGTGIHDVAIVAGQTSTTTFTNAATATITAAKAQITLTGGDTTTNIKVGALVSAIDGGVLAQYNGRVVSIDSSTLFTVSPAPPLAMAPTAGNLITYPVQASTGGKCATSFQNRLLFGNSYDLSSYRTGIPLRNDRRVTYGVLPTESSQLVGGGTTYYGMYSQMVLTGGWPALNYFDIPGQDPIVALEPIDDNQLLILTTNQPVIFRGDLITYPGTQTAAPTVTFEESAILQPAGCLSDLSVQRTRQGIVWAGAGGIYAYRGGQRIDDLTGDGDNKLINAYWRTLTANTTSFVIHGSAYIRGHYLISGAVAGVTFSLMADLTGSRVKWTRLSGVGTDIFYGLTRPTNQAQVFALRWWDQTGAAPSQTNGQTLRLESMLNPYVTGATTTDADGTAITATITTRVLDGDSETQKIAQRVTLRHQQSSTTAAMAVTGQSKIDAADISAASVRALGSLSNTSVLTISSATNANPIVITTSANHGLQTDDFVDIDGVTGNTNANGRWRISVTGNTTFSLVGGIGNGAGGGSPTCKKITETDYLASPLNAGQGYSFTATGTPNYFELHGLTLAYLERPRVMST